jgi:competence protein ComEA
MGVAMASSRSPITKELFMKATRFAVLLFVFVISFQALAVDKNVQPNVSPPVEENLAKINLNTADVMMLTGAIKGIGKNRAQAIVNYRETHGGFKSVEELAQVKGLGKSFVNHHLDKVKAVFEVAEVSR